MIKYELVDDVWFVVDPLTGVFVWNEDKETAKGMLLEALEDWYEFEGE